MRKHYLDNIRWITILLVVLFHVIFIFNGVSIELVGPFHDPQYQDALLYLLYPWFMVLLFVVAGACSRFALEKRTAREFLSERTVKLLVPSTIGLFVFQWITGFVNMSVSGVFDDMAAGVPGFVLYPIMAISGTGVLWFIQMLWIFSVLLLVIRHFEKGKLYGFAGRCGVFALLLMVVPLWLSAQVLNTPVVTVYRFGIYGLAFLLGYFVFANDSVVERLSRCWLPLLSAAAVLGAGYVWFYFGQDYAAEPVINSPFSIVFCWVTVLAVFAVMKRFGDVTSNAAAWLGRRSFGLYVLHYLPLAAAALWICSGFSLPALPSYVITGAAALLGGFGLYELISRVPVIRWCVLGIRRKSVR